MRRAELLALGAADELVRAELATRSATGLGNGALWRTVCVGSSSFPVEGRGNEAARCSSAHGTGRALRRTAARANMTERKFRRQMEGVWYDYRRSEQLRDEPPAVSKDVKAVLRAQRDLVKVTRVQRPLLNYRACDMSVDDLDGPQP